MTAEDAEASRSRLTTAVSVGDECADAVLFIETATERLDIKHQIMRRASEVLPADAIIGTNTSALSITEIAAVVPRPERVIGMRSEERRVGKECVSKCRSRWSPDH